MLIVVQCVDVSLQYVKQTFAACKDPLEKQQLCYILGRQVSLLFCFHRSHHSSDPVYHFGQGFLMGIDFSCYMKLHHSLLCDLF